jgi:hypothetical protein
MMEELRKMEIRLGDRIVGCYVGLERHVVEVEHRSEECFISLEMARTEAESSHVTLEKEFDGLKLEVNRLNGFLERENLEHSAGRPGIILSSVGDANGQGRHRGDVRSRDSKVGLMHPPPQIQTNNMNHESSLPHMVDLSQDLLRAHSRSIYADAVRVSQGRLPKLHFLMFNGEDRQLWKSRCECYFEMYGVEQPLWICVAYMHFEATAARWLQSVERKIMDVSWDSLCSMVHDHFGRDQHEALIR